MVRILAKMANREGIRLECLLNDLERKKGTDLSGLLVPIDHGKRYLSGAVNGGYLSKTTR